MGKSFIDKIWEDKKEFDKFEIPEFKIDHEKIREYSEEFNKLDIYLPIRILEEVDWDYPDRATAEALEQMRKANRLYRYLCENALDGEEDLSYELVLKDLYAWVQEHKEYEDILIYSEE